jgi:hypothetical protein
VEWQCAKEQERVTYLEKVVTENVFGTRYECWNVRTNKERYWVITGPTNLYSQKLFPSLDYTLSFHIGLMARVQAKRKGTTDDRLADFLASAFRRWEQAAEALDRSEESEEIQAVGMRCRECLLALVRSVGSISMVPQGEQPPKAGDFVHWSELIANAIAAGESNSEIRGYLKTTTRSTWQLVSWLTHAANAVRYDGTIAVDATHALLNAFGTALMRHSRKVVDRCPRCGSLRMTMVYQPDSEVSETPACESCGWTVGKASLRRCINEEGRRMTLLLSREVPTEVDVAVTSFKASVVLTPADALAVAGELLTASAARLKQKA